MGTHVQCDRLFVWAMGGSLISAQEFDRDHSGMLESHDVTSLMLRLIPDVDRKDMRYIRNMVDIAGVKQVRRSQARRPRCQCLRTRERVRRQQQRLCR